MSHHLAGATKQVAILIINSILQEDDNELANGGCTVVFLFTAT